MIYPLLITAHALWNCVQCKLALKIRWYSTLVLILVPMHELRVDVLVN